MTAVLDACALVSMLRGEPAARDVAALLRRGPVAMTTVNLGEAIDIMHRRYGASLAELRTDVASLAGESLAVNDVDAGLAWRAAALRRLHYRRADSALSLSDCLAMAACPPGGQVVSSDGALLRAARAEGLRVLVLPDSAGVVPVLEDGAP